MEHHNGSVRQHDHHTVRHAPVDTATHLRRQQHKRESSGKREAVSLASLAYQSMHAGGQHGSKKAWHE